MTTIHPAHLLPNAHRPSNRLLQRLERLRIHHRKESSPLSAKSSITPEDHISLSSTAKHTITKSTAPEQQPAGHKPTAGEIAKDVAISMIPIAGTVYEFKKGNIGWGIFSLFTDLLCLIPVVGPLARVVSGAIRGGAVAARAIRAGAVAAEAGTKIATAVAEAGAKALTTATEAGAKAVTTAAEASVKTAVSTTKTAKDFAEFSGKIAVGLLRAMDPGVELLYNAGKGLAKFFGKNSGKIATGFVEKEVTHPFMHSFFSNNPILKNFASLFEKRTQWKLLDKFNNTERSREVADLFRKKYLDLSDTGPHLSEVFKDELAGSEYIINGKKIEKNDINKALAEFGREVTDPAHMRVISKHLKKENLNKMLGQFNREVTDPGHRQFISVFANREILSEPSLHFAIKDSRYKDIIPKGNYFTYKINTLPDGKVTLTAKCRQPVDTVAKNTGIKRMNLFSSDAGKKYTELCFRADTILEPDMLFSTGRAPTIIYSYRLK